MTKRLLQIGIALVVVLAAAGVFLATSPETLLRLAMAAERGAANLETRSMRWGEHDIVYLEGGTPGKPTLVLVHGFSGDKDNWTRFGAHLGDRFRLLAPDLPGHGESSRIESHAYSVPNQVRFLEAFVDATAPGRFHLAGNSMGGHIAGLYAVAHPERVATLSLLNNAGVRGTEPSERERLIADTGRNPLLVDDVEDFERMLAFTFVEVPSIPGPVRNYFAERATQNRDFNEKMYADVTAAGAFLLEPELPRLTMPVLILWGDTDRVISPTVVPVMERVIPKSTTKWLKGCGHLPMIERPEESAAVLEAFIAGA